MKKFYSPLRYPGGKNRLARFIALLCKENGITKKDGHYVEPYAGGASVALFLLINGHVSRITINDEDRAIYAFWYSILNHSERFISKIRRTQVTKKTWQRCRELIQKKDSASLFELGFATFFLNRTNVSGIINGGMIGGLQQKGKYKLDCRFNKQELIHRIRDIASQKRRISLFNLDALDLIKVLKKDKKTLFYFDPPYYLKGESLYLNHYQKSDHKQVGKQIQSIKNARWIVSYDPAKQIKRIYRGYKQLKYSLLHTARVARVGHEILFLSKNVCVPKVKDPIKVL